MMNNYLAESKLLDYSASNIQQLIKKQGWRQLDDFDKIKQIYNFVMNDIAFGFNVDDKIPASKILKDGYGQCNTKSILIMALFRAVDIPCRFHGFTLDKKVQSGILGKLYALAPAKIIHTWAEVYYEKQWFQLEGLILDSAYLKRLQQKNKNCEGSFCGWGAGTKNLQNPPVEWNTNSTYIQKEGIIEDLNVFDTPDDFFNLYRQKVGLVKGFVFRNIARHYMNRNVRKMRQGLI